MEYQVNNPNNTENPPGCPCPWSHPETCRVCRAEWAEKQLDLGPRANCRSYLDIPQTDKWAEDFGRLFDRSAALW